MNYDIWRATDPWWEDGYYDHCETCEEEQCECTCEKDEAEVVSMNPSDIQEKGAGDYGAGD